MVKLRLGSSKGALLDDSDKVPGDAFGGEKAWHSILLDVELPSWILLAVQQYAVAYLTNACIPQFLTCRFGLYSDVFYEHQ